MANKLIFVFLALVVMVTVVSIGEANYLVPGFIHRPREPYRHRDYERFGHHRYGGKPDKIVIVTKGWVIISNVITINWLSIDNINVMVNWFKITNKFDALEISKTLNH